MITGVYPEGNKPTKDKYFLRLQDNEDRIYLRIVNESGEYEGQGYLLKISKDTGNVFLCASISTRFGLDIDDEGKLKVK